MENHQTDYHLIPNISPTLKLEVLNLHRRKMGNILMIYHLFNLRSQSLHDYVFQEY